MVSVYPTPGYAKLGGSKGKKIAGKILSYLGIGAALAAGEKGAELALTSKTGQTNLPSIARDNDDDDDNEIAIWAISILVGIFVMFVACCGCCCCLICGYGVGGLLLNKNREENL